jgi:hypothetical protein
VENKEREEKRAGAIFGIKISSTPAEDSKEAREALEKEKGTGMDSGGKNQMEKGTDGNTKIHATPTEGSNKKNGQILVAGRRPAKGLNSITILIDKDVEELINAVIHPSSNKAMAMNELLRMSLKEIYNRKGDLIIK